MLKIDDIIEMSVLENFDSLEAFLESSNKVFNWQNIKSTTVKSLLELEVTQEELIDLINTHSKMYATKRTLMGHNHSTKISRYISKINQLQATKKKISDEDFI